MFDLILLGKQHRHYGIAALNQLSEYVLAASKIDRELMKCFLPYDNKCTDIRGCHLFVMFGDVYLFADVA